MDEVNLLDDGLVDVVLDSAASGINTVEREGVSIQHPARFIMIGSGNPQARADGSPCAPWPAVPRRQQLCSAGGVPGSSARALSRMACILEKSLRICGPQVFTMRVAGAVMMVLPDYAHFAFFCEEART